MVALQYLLMIVLFLLAVFLIVLVLIQRGKGGGLAGALGGMGGQSAFGTKAGDLFTRITIGVAAAWIILCIISVKVLTLSGEQLNLGPVVGGQQQSQPSEGAEPTGGGTPESSGEPGGASTTPAAPASSDAGSKK